MAKELKGTATAEQITKWKKEHGEVSQVTGGDSVCYLKKPDRKTMSYVATLANDPIRANEALLANCWLGGDEAFKTDDSLFYGISQQLQSLVEVKDVELKKL